MPTTAYINTIGDRPTMVTVDGVSVRVAREPADAPAARIASALDSVGYEMTGPFVGDRHGGATVPVQHTWRGLLDHLRDFAAHGRGVYVDEIGGLPRVYLDTALCVGILATMTDAEMRSYEGGRDEVLLPCPS